MNEHWTERLSDYLDGDLTAADARACEAHLAECADCRAVLDELRMVVSFAQADSDQVPTTNLWPGIHARIAGANVVPFRRRSYSFTLPQLALAASLLIAVSAGVAYLAVGRVSLQQGLLEDPIQAQAEPLMPASASVERANFADAQFDQAVSDLEKILVDMRDELDPRTIMVIERNLSAIDDAIREARAALDADPANTFLNSHLADSRRKKLELLRRATMIHSTSGD